MCKTVRMALLIYNVSVKTRISKLCTQIIPVCVKAVLTSTQASCSHTVLCLLIVLVSLVRTGLNNDNTRWFILIHFSILDLFDM